ncbi:MULTISPECIES: glycine betaine ABC transporter substrate-binding protein [Brevibacillus]|jgi:ABC-type proline/glycine betaine transport systems, periplasmic components|uniref:Glycine/betaine ABC transporter substrate-binding protein n=1 Tax=Brevibacillus parabrevis TaxID=54914 RepID=A0A4Y3PX52_BREPA|nr:MULTISPECIES: glycine betaine ABC transporter substrate-binding protein [Brevibacillus]MBU8713751.1 glycine/betaine ABC transporter [Brevibacillus parabrevis]MDH6350790.1 glycine betaine/proline transport system substrate-binding protein [Brevibacillus sp. 1238]MED2255303.1 glycine betaine ABC transporter substrate-binding protein [Brevibacillus parabrevis]RNB92580.1 glycine/betaine ABC transporter [Brevibacillus parabrevis]UED68454.1 glycine/betaine ABC transporter [Brevibacillus sp. HD3.3
MKKATWKGLAVALGLGLVMAGCSSAGSSEGNGSTSSNNGSAASNGVGAAVDHKIIGIDPGAGLMKATEKVLKDYELKDWELVEGSSAAMTAALTQAYKDKKPIIVTGWTPHWMFSKFEMKYLEDPKGVYGKDEQIHTVVRKGLKEEQPSAYAFLDKFSWTPADMEKVMLDIEGGKKPEEAAAEWVKANEATVSKWVEGVQPANGQKLTLAYVAWDSEIASTNVVKTVLEQKLNYKVELSQVEAGPMWVGVSNGDVDGMVAAWLPTTHADYMEKLGKDVEDLGPNLEGTKLGLAVPTYMDITSIEDLKK